MNLQDDKIKKIFLRYAIPSVLTAISQRLAEFVDTIFIGNYIGKEGLSAVTLFFPLVSILMGIGLMIAIGSNTMAGIKLGENDLKRSNYFFNFAVKVLVVFSLTCSTLVVIFFRYFIDVLSIDQTTMLYLSEYGSTISMFFVVYVLNIVFAFFVQLEGKPKIIVVTILLGTALNILLDYVFIVLLEGSLFGAAMATGLSQVFIFIVLLLVIVKRTSWRLQRIKIELKSTLNIFANGLSVLLNRSSTAISGAILNFFILKYYGIPGLAAYGVIIQILSILASISAGISDASRVGVSVNYGAKRFQRTQSFRNIALKTNLVVGALMVIMSFCYKDSLVRIFTTDHDVIQMALVFISYYGVVYFLIGFNVTTSTYYTSINDSLTSGLFTVYRSLISIVIGLSLFVFVYEGKGIWFAVMFKEISSFVIAMIILKTIPLGMKRKEMNAYGV